MLYHTTAPCPQLSVNFLGAKGPEAAADTFAPCKRWRIKEPEDEIDGAKVPVKKLDVSIIIILCGNFAMCRVFFVLFHKFFWTLDFLEKNH